MRLKVKKSHHELAHGDGYVYFDIDPAHNPFEVARIMATRLSNEPPREDIFALSAGKDKVLYNWSGIKSGTAVKVWGFCGEDVSTAFHETRGVSISPDGTITPTDDIF